MNETANDTPSAPPASPPWRRAVLLFGLASGLLSSVLLFVNLPFIREHRMGVADTLGYASMLLTVLLVFFGIRSFRGDLPDGRLGFGRGFVVGALIALVSSLVYALVFELVYFVVEPDFGAHFVACMIERARDAGADADKLRQTAGQAATLRGLYDNPWSNAALTLATTWPVGLVAAAISALVLRRR